RLAGTVGTQQTRDGAMVEGKGQVLDRNDGAVTLAQRVNRDDRVSRRRLLRPTVSRGRRPGHWWTPAPRIPVRCRTTTSASNPIARTIPSTRTQRGVPVVDPRRSPALGSLSPGSRRGSVIRVSSVISVAGPVAWAVPWLTQVRAAGDRTCLRPQSYSGSGLSRTARGGELRRPHRVDRDPLAGGVGAVTCGVTITWFMQSTATA